MADDSPSQTQELPFFQRPRSLLGLSPADWLSIIGGGLGGVSVRQGGATYQPFLPIAAAAGVLGNQEQIGRQRMAAQELSQYLPKDQADLLAQFATMGQMTGPMAERSLGEASEQRAIGDVSRIMQPRPGRRETLIEGQLPVPEAGFAGREEQDVEIGPEPRTQSEILSSIAQLPPGRQAAAFKLSGAQRAPTEAPSAEQFRKFRELRLANRARGLSDEDAIKAARAEAFGGSKGIAGPMVEKSVMAQLRSKYGDALTQDADTAETAAAEAREMGAHQTSQSLLALARLRKEGGKPGSVIGQIEGKVAAGTPLSAGEQQVYDAHHKAPKEGVKEQEVEDWLEAHSLPNTAANRVKAREGMKKDTSGDVDLTPEALEGIAGEVAGGTPISNFITGWGGKAQANKNRVMNRVMQLRRERGEEPGSFGETVAVRQADVAELKKLQTMRGPILAFTSTANQNLGIALRLSEKVDRTGTPVFNRYQMKLRGEYLGDPDVTAFETAIGVAREESAKVLSGAVSAAAITDAARSSVDKYLNTAQTPAQFKASVGVLREDMSARNKGLDERITAARGSMRRGGRPSAEPPSDGPTMPPGVAPPTAKKMLSKEQYEEAKRRGATDDQIRAKGFEVPK